MNRNLRTTCKTVIALVPAALALCVTAAGAADVGVDLNLHLGNQPRQVVVPAPAPIISIDQDVEFVYPGALGFYVAVGVPYDLFYQDNAYFLFRDGRWYRAAGSRGPWIVVRHRDLPPGLRRHRMERIREYRDAEYAIYRRDRDHYRGRHFKRDKDEWKAERKAEKEMRKEDRREEKEYRKEMKRQDKEDRKAEKEERKRHKHDND